MMGMTYERISRTSPARRLAVRMRDTAVVLLCNLLPLPAPPPSSCPSPLPPELRVPLFLSPPPLRRQAKLMVSQAQSQAMSYRHNHRSLGASHPAPFLSLRSSWQRSTQRGRANVSYTLRRLVALRQGSDSASTQGPWLMRCHSLPPRLRTTGFGIRGKEPCPAAARPLNSSHLPTLRLHHHRLDFIYST